MQPVYSQFVYLFVVDKDTRVHKRIKGTLDSVVDVILSSGWCNEFDVDSKPLTEPQGDCHAVHDTLPELFSFGTEVRSVLGMAEVHICGRWKW